VSENQNSTSGLGNGKRHQKGEYIEERAETSESDGQSVLEHLFPWLPWKKKLADLEERKSENVRTLPEPNVWKY
jgi:hypothetical protein